MSGIQQAVQQELPECGCDLPLVDPLSNVIKPEYSGEDRQYCRQHVRQDVNHIGDFQHSSIYDILRNGDEYDRRCKTWYVEHNCCHVDREGHARVGGCQPLSVQDVVGEMMSDGLLSNCVSPVRYS